jgi:hypothetical protein
MRLPKNNRKQNKTSNSKFSSSMGMRKAPSDLAMKALSMYDEQAKREKLMRKIVAIALISLIPIIGIALTILMMFMKFDFMSLVTWLVDSDVLTTLSYTLIIIMSIGVFGLLFVRIWQMRRSLSSHIKGVNK